MTEASPQGRRERKKNATRTKILDAATALFLERGFDAVTVSEIANAADVTSKTVFAHFAQKEALLFGDEAQQHARLVAAVRNREQTTPISAALRAHYLKEIAEMNTGPGRRLLAVMEQAPTVVEYAERMWVRHEDALIAEITRQFRLDVATDAIRLYVRFALQIQLLARRSPDPGATIDAGFGLLDEGWRRYCSTIDSLL
ncbi:TetR/AcrR family transcriptional regulator [Paramicrobacterium fandaimingii]|uniref:TetR/AcrR family transcriptional regulator n=1 Tax=Paramicrobacterium fandaimingii TaxID=2708079 RepID=UPI00141E9CC4|nr:TetR/AcrR family transcriptional regulator [Microbacterium fandaimingii]